jgi:HK97 family phage prohead protease
MPSYIASVDFLAVPFHAGNYQSRETADLAFPNESGEAFSCHAFDNVLKRNDNVRALLEHMPGQRLGDTADGGLVLASNSDGLWARVYLPDTGSGREALRGIQAGELRGASIGFNALDWGWAGSYGNRNLRKVVTDAKLIEVSLCQNPAYRETERLGLHLTLLPHGQRQAALTGNEYREEVSDGEDESTRSRQNLEWAASENSEAGFRAKRELTSRAARLLKAQQFYARR